jgi:cytochrome P450
MTQVTAHSLDDRLTALFASDQEALAQAPGLYRELREDSPVHEHPSAVLFSRHDDARVLLRDDVNFGKAERYMNDTVRQALAQMADHQQHAHAELSAFESLQLTAADGTEHTRLRGIMHRAMTQGRIAALESSVHVATNELLEPLREHDVADLMQFAYRLPLMVICDLLGIPAADREQIHVWTSAIGRNKGGIPYPDVVVAAHAAMGEFRSYLDGMIEEHRRVQGHSDLLAALMNAEGERLTTEELAANFAMLLLAGHETTTNLIGIGLLELLRHPDQWRALCAAPEHAASAVEELLRYVSPVQWVLRIPLHEVEYGGLTIPKGRLVFVILAAANRDPAAFREPERLDIARIDSSNLLTFALGPHFCLGNSLARLEARIALQTLARRFPHMRLATDEIHWQGNARLRSLTALPVALGPRGDQR